jgi:hypothetical protein
MSAKKTTEDTPFWFAEWKSSRQPSVWKKVRALKNEEGWQLVYYGQSRKDFIQLTGPMTTFDHLLFYGKAQCKEYPGEWRLRGALPYNIEDIVIEPPTPDYDRFETAHALQEGCNPSGIARELVRIIAAATHDPNCSGTRGVCSDAAVIATIDKLQSLCLRDAILAHTELRKRAEGKHLDFNKETGKIEKDEPNAS